MGCGGPSKLQVWFDAVHQNDQSKIASMCWDEHNMGDEVDTSAVGIGEKKRWTSKPVSPTPLTSLCQEHPC